MMDWKRRKITQSSASPAKERICNGISISILDLPICILVEIFLRLSISTVVDCKRVCKAWYKFISDTEFASVYLRKPPFTSVILPVEKNGLCLLELKGGYDYTSKRICPKICRTPDGFSRGSVTILGSCNGLLCLAHYIYGEEQNYRLYVCNPLLGEYVMLPQPKVDKRIREEVYGFGFSPKTDQYKLFRIITRKWRVGKTEAQVCTVGIGNDWRVLRENAPFPLARKCLGEILSTVQICEVTLKGALHWISGDLSKPDFIYSFDIGEEKVRLVPHPHGMVERNRWTSLGVLHDCLCVFQVTRSSPGMDIWRMMKYGEVESWTRETIMDSCLPQDLEYRRPYHPTLIWKTSEMLMCPDYGPLICYNIEEKTAMEVATKVDRRFRSLPVPFHPCFLSLIDVLEAGHVEGVGGELNFVMGCTRDEITSPNNKRNAGTSIMDLPTFILVNILSRVPSITILCIKSVCKTWYRFISDPHFADTYFTARRSVNLVLSTRDSACSFLELKAGDNNDNQLNYKSGLPARLSDDRVAFLGSCNGLICFSVSSNSMPNYSVLFICNLLLRKFSPIPIPKVEKNIREDVYGFGYSPLTGHYKILRIFTKKWHPGKSEAHVCTIGSDKDWRVIENHTPFPMGRKWSEFSNVAHLSGAAVNGALHWIVENSQNPDFIYSFDLCDEEVHQVPPPPYMGKRSSWTSLGVLRDCLCVYHTICPANLDIWSMKDYGVGSSWTKESFSADHIPVGLANHAVLPILTWRSGELLMQVDSGPLISYCPKSKKCNVLQIESDFGGCFIAAPHFPSFLSPKTALKECHLVSSK